MAEAGQSVRVSEWELERILTEAERQMQAAPTADAIYEAAWRAAIRLGECDSFSISRFDAREAIIRAAFARHYAAPINVRELPPLLLESPGVGTQSRVINEGRAILFDDFRAAWATTERRFAMDDEGKVIPLAPAPAPEDGQFPPSAMMAPLREGRTPVGVMALYSTSHQAYAEEQLKGLERLADLVSARLLALPKGAKA